MFASFLLQSLFQSWDKGLMTSSQTADSHYMSIIINGLSSNLFRSLEKPTNIHIKSEISEATGNDLCTSVMAILTHFSN
jgi:hypothetical protein